MRRDFGSKTWMYPQPVLIISTYNDDGSADAMNAAWGGISAADEISICVNSEHKTTENILKTKAFTVSMADASHVKECDYLGIVSGKKILNKIEKAGFTVSKSKFVNAPLINELSLSLECSMLSYDKENCRLTGKIINVSADEKILDENGQIDINKLDAIVFDPIHHTYRKVGEKVGNAFSDGSLIK